MKNGNFSYLMYLTTTLYNVKNELKFINKLAYNNENKSMQEKTSQSTKKHSTKSNVRERAHTK